MSTTYTAMIQEDDENLKILLTNQYNIQVARSVSSPDGAPTFNVVYKSAVLNNYMSLTWSTIYCLNWTREVPNPGAMVSFGGTWQVCSLGQSYDLNEAGNWVPNKHNPHADPKSVNVGSNGSKTTVHVVVGIKDPATDKYAPIWVSPTPFSAHAEYMPRQSIKLWYQQGERNGTVIASNEGARAQKFATTSTHLFYFSYKAASGTWLTPQATPFPI